MKKMLKILFAAFSIFAITACANTSKDGGRPPRAEKISKENFYKGLDLNNNVQAKVDVILSDFKLTLDKTFKDSKMPPEKDKMEILIKARDIKIKPLLTEAQYVTYKKTVEGLFIPDNDRSRRKPR